MENPSLTQEEMDEIREELDKLHDIMENPPLTQEEMDETREELDKLHDMIVALS